MKSIVVMGVAGCGKSSLGQAIAQAEGLPLIEGDDFHSAANKALMSAGTPLTDADREGWLATLGEQLAAQRGGAVLTCSALKRAYRDRLRRAAPGLRFVFLEIGREAAQQRVTARAAQHFFSTDLVTSQFETLEPPHGEAGVLVVDALAPIDRLAVEVRAWMNAAAR
jgi:gluconokinase